VPELFRVGSAAEQKPNRGGNARDCGEAGQYDAEMETGGESASDGGVVFDEGGDDRVKQVHGGTPRCRRPMGHG